MTPKADVLIAARDRVQIDTLRQLFRGMGVRGLVVTIDAEEARRILLTSRMDTMIICEGLRGEDALAFLRSIRRNVDVPSRRGHMLYVGPTDMASKAINAGAHAAMSLPISLSGLMQVHASMKSDDRPFVELTQYVGPCRRTKRVAGREIPRRRLSDQQALAAQLLDLFDDRRKALAKAAGVAAASGADKSDGVFFAVMELERVAREMDDKALIFVSSALGEALSRRARVDKRLAVLIEEYAAAIGHLVHLPIACDKQRGILAGHIVALAERIGKRAADDAPAASSPQPAMASAARAAK
ncbi:MAG: hypothetical protein ACOYKM_10840 [Caulobacterales bacterium]